MQAFYYHKAGLTINRPTFRVYVRGENLKEAVMKMKIVNNDGYRIQYEMLIRNRLYVPLLPGLHQVILEGERSSDGISGLLVDDLAIDDCAQLGRVLNNRGDN